MHDYHKTNASVSVPQGRRERFSGMFSTICLYKTSWIILKVCGCFWCCAVYDLSDILCTHISSWLIEGSFHVKSDTAVPDALRFWWKLVYLKCPIKEACVQNISPEWPPGSDLEVIKGHDFSRALQHSTACSFVQLHSDCQSDYWNNVESLTINI